MLGSIVFAPQDPDRPAQCRPAEFVQSTHWETCWKSHPECARARNFRLRAVLAGQGCPLNQNLFDVAMGEQFTGGTSRFAAVQEEA